MGMYDKVNADEVIGIAEQYGMVILTNEEMKYQILSKLFPNCSLMISETQFGIINTDNPIITKNKMER